MRRALLTLLLLLPAAARAQGAPDDSDWELQVGEVGPVAKTPEGSFSLPESIRFGEAMRKRALDQLCKSVEIPLGGGYGVDGVGAVNGKVHRRIETLPHLPGEKLGLVDETRLSLDLGHTFELGQVGDAAFGISVFSKLEGSSLVVRPLPTNRACKELKALAKVWTYKTAAPMSAQRLGAMQVGEMWKLPLQLTIGHSEGVAVPLQPWAGVTLSLGTSQAGAAIMTVYRLSEEQLRFRFRVDHVRVKARNGAVSASYPAAQVFSPFGEDILGKLLNHEIAKQLQHYLQASFGLFRSSSDGQQVLMEFLLDPRKPEDMEALSQALRGDLRALVSMAYRLVTLQATAPGARSSFGRLHESNAAIFGKSGNPGLNLYRDKSGGFNLNLPFFLSLQRAKSSREDQFIDLDDGGQFTVYKEDKTRGAGGIEIPIKGQLLKHNELRSAQAYVYETADGVSSKPQAVYIFQDGFLRRDADSVRETVTGAARIVELAGAKGGAPVPRMKTPVDKLLPPPPPRGWRADGTPEAAPTYHDGSVSLTLVLTEKAVEAILTAGAELVARCFQNTLDAQDQARFGVALALASFDADGAMTYDRRRARQAFSEEAGDRGAVDRMCRVVSAIVRDLAAARQAGTPAAQAQELTRLLAGKGESGLAYEDILAVLIQLVDPLDVTADFSVNIRKKLKGEQDVHAHMTLAKNRAENALLKEVGAAKQRFARPSDLVD